MIAQKLILNYRHFALHVVCCVVGRCWGYFWEHNLHNCGVLPFIVFVLISTHTASYSICNFLWGFQSNDELEGSCNRAVHRLFEKRFSVSASFSRTHVEAIKHTFFELILRNNQFQIYNHFRIALPPDGCSLAPPSREIWRIFATFQRFIANGGEWKSDFYAKFYVLRTIHEEEVINYVVCIEEKTFWHSSRRFFKNFSSTRKMRRKINHFSNKKLSDIGH